MALNRTDRVLVVDGLRETADVLRAVLEPRGFDVARVRGGAASGSDCDAPMPRVIVMHQEDDQPDCSPAVAWSDVPRVIISSDEHAESPPRLSTGRQRYLQKPFQYGELIHAIERLLENAAA